MNDQRIIWLASFPKSGNTWMRTFLEAYFEGKGKRVDINTLNRFSRGDIQQYIFDRAAGRPFEAKTVEEWLEMRPKALKFLVDSKPGFHFVKTHCLPRRYKGHYDLIPPELTAAAIYIMRNPFDVAPSYARHLGTDIDGSIERMTYAKNTHATPTGLLEVVGRWDDHVKSWTTPRGLTRHVMRYEEMVGEPEKTFRALLDFLRVPREDGRLRRALRQTSFERLSRQERAAGFRERPEGMEQFFARGRAGGWRETLTPEQVARLRAEFLPTLETWYPELLAETEEYAGTAAS